MQREELRKLADDIERLSRLVVELTCAGVAACGPENMALALTAVREDAETILVDLNDLSKRLKRMEKNL